MLALNQENYFQKLLSLNSFSFEVVEFIIYLLYFVKKYSRFAFRLVQYSKLEKLFTSNIA